MPPAPHPRRPAAAGGRRTPRETPASRTPPAALRIPVRGFDPRLRSCPPAGPHGHSSRQRARRRLTASGSVRLVNRWVGDWGDEGTGDQRTRVRERHETVTFTFRLLVFSPSVADN